MMLADDHLAVRAALQTLLRGLPGVELVGEAGDGADAVSRDILDTYARRTGAGWQVGVTGSMLPAEKGAASEYEQGGRTHDSAQ